jgi:hypothetical protein
MSANPCHKAELERGAELEVVMKDIMPNPIRLDAACL